MQNFPEAEFGVIEGKVKSISQTPDNDGFYYVQIQIADTLVTSYKKEIKLQQETSVIAEIITKDLRPIERFFYQFKDMFSRS